MKNTEPTFNWYKCTYYQASLGREKGEFTRDVIAVNMTEAMQALRGTVEYAIAITGCHYQGSQAQYMEMLRDATEN